MKVLKYFSIFVISFSISSCNFLKKDDIPYELKDTWGENGDWSNNKDNKKSQETKIEEVKKEVKKVKDIKEEVKTEEPKKEDVKVEDVKNDDDKKDLVKDNSSSQIEQSKFKDDKLEVALDVASWEKEDSVSKIRLFSKSFENDKVMLSMANLKGLNDKLLDKSFKDKYINALKTNLKDFQLISNSEEKYSNKNSWVISYITTKDDLKLQQKQIFIPKKDNTLLINIVSTEETMFKAEPEIFKTLSTLEVY